MRACTVCALALAAFGLAACAEREGERVATGASGALVAGDIITEAPPGAGVTGRDVIADQPPGGMVGVGAPAGMR